MLRVLEICAGAGGQALGLEQANFYTAAAVEIDTQACNTLRLNRPDWNVIETDLKEFNAQQYKNIDLLAGGVPCPPFSMAGKQLGADDERDLFPTALRLVEECNPKAVMLENVRGLSSPKFAEYRQQISTRLISMGYSPKWELVFSSRFGVPQLRPRFILVAMKEEYSKYFKFPEGTDDEVTVGDAIFDLMSKNGWTGAKKWKTKSASIAPTLVGGSKKHGGADLGPTRAKQTWLGMGVDGKGIVEDAPGSDAPIEHIPRLTIRMVARIQGFPDSWTFAGKKTSQYRQIGNALPPPVAKALGDAISNALNKMEVEYVENEQIHLEFID